MNPAGNLIFEVRTLHIKDGKSLKSIKPDKNGVYRKVPVAVIGKASRGASYYDEESLINCMTNPNSAFYKKLIEGGLEGEWGHPFYVGNDQASLKRIMYVDRTKVSHNFIAVYTEKTEDGTVIIYADIVPSGPYGKYLIESFEDEKRNTSFSLRSLTAPPKIMNNIMYKKVLALVTFDGVETGGYEEASKRFMSSTESLMEFPINTMDFINNSEYKLAVGFEHLNNEQIFDMLDTDKIIVEKKTVGIVTKDKTLVSPTGEKLSVFHNMYK